MGLVRNERKIKIDGAGIRRIYLFAVLTLQLIAYPIAVFRLGEYSYEVYYGIVVSCFLTSIVFLKKDAQSFLQVGALLFTCVADYYLILNGGSFVTGVGFFIVAQSFYCARTLLYAKGKTERILNLSIRAALSALMPFIAYMVLGDGVESLFVISLIYYVNLLINIVFSFLHFKENKLLAIGLTLFALCDTALGLEEVVDIFAIPAESPFYKIFCPPFCLEAVFYCPSQALLSVSAQNRAKTIKSL